MNETEYVAIAESGHEVQNPTSPAKLGEVAEHLEIGAGDRVLDVGSGRGFWAVELAKLGADVVGLEINADFTAAAEQRAAAAGVRQRLRTVLGPAAEFEPEPGASTVGSCLGASFAFGGYRQALEWLAGALADGGRLAIGELHSLDDSAGDELPSLSELVHIAEELDFEVTGLVSASTDDWDRYESQHWKNVLDWAKRNPEHPERDSVLADSRRFRNDYLSHRGELGWTIVLGAKKVSAG
ncbi:MULTISPECIES: cyclopropane-fatty-acyl-phospholipid synthase family protein [unclassified Saccharopolyspora]|uniref:SAM-dependent methyltransferase n=1 Tax=Saccharopolyspora TaxID=1835 RepID=UPI00190B1289|nr:methyltransferase domain-containing protein [Saccharopolyspora sp. HNM0986]MBK0869856.1 methyltransferase domain-containing protein [Saccharopolyspora sp. HNM0986]